ncbi:MAG: hypothetical protein GX851_03860, partial [Clostridiales bacterium]|nr:hypothetical protein [Clostridiales bacterium]
MNVMMKELKKLLNPVSLLVSVAVFLMITFWISPITSIKNMLETNTDCIAQVVRIYGARLDQTEREELETTVIASYYDEINSIIAADADFKAAGIKNYDDYRHLIRVKYDLSRLDGENSTEEEILRMFGETKPEDYIISPAEQKIIDHSWSDDSSSAAKVSALCQGVDSLKSQLEHYYDKQERTRDISQMIGIKGKAALERDKEFFAGEEYTNIMSEIVTGELSKTLSTAAVAVLLGLCVILAPAVTKDRMCEVLALQYTSRKGRKTLFSQLGAMLVAAFVLASVEIGITVGIFSSFIPKELWSCGLNSFNSIFMRFFFRGTLLEYTIAVIVLIYVACFACTLMLFAISCKSKNYISMLFKAIPWAAFSACFSFFVLKTAFAYYSGDGNKYLRDLIPVPYIEAYACALMVA